MEKEYFIQLTKNLYRLTLLFPKKEPLRNRMRAMANDILANLISILEGNLHKSANRVHEVENNLEILNSFFEVARAQNWVSSDNVLEIQKEYSNIKEEIEAVKVAEPEISISDSNSQERNRSGMVPGTGERQSLSEREESGNENDNNFLNERHQKILEVLKERGKVQVGELVSVFPRVSKRTLRRDFHSLLKRGLVKRTGEKNYTFYQLS